MVEQMDNDTDYYDTIYHLEQIKEKVEAITKTICMYQKVEEAYKKYQNDVITNIYAGKKLVKALEEVLDGKID